MSSEIAGLDVSRETIERLKDYLSLLEKWNPKINLVSPDTINHAWTRHFIDSAQLAKICNAEAENWVDLGSGGGFPGLVIAILLHERKAKTRVALVESDQRKCAFLRTVNRELDLNARIISKRIEDVDCLEADVLSARALAPLTQLLQFSTLHLRSEGIGLFPKGQSWKKELEEAQARWNFSWRAHKSETNPEAVVLEIKDLSHV